MHGLWIVTMIFGVVASLIGYSKGRNSLGWFLAGTFLGPFALIVTFLPAVEREGMFMRCPSCREVIREDAITCRYCHSMLDRA